jgi:hypothetical protein
VTDDLTRRLAEQILRGVKELHEEQNPGAPLSPGTPIAPHAAAERIGISPIGRWYAALEYLEEEGALEPNVRPGKKESWGTRSTSWERALRSCWRVRKERSIPRRATPVRQSYTWRSTNTRRGASSGRPRNTCVSTNLPATAPPQKRTRLSKNSGRADR